MPNTPTGPKAPSYTVRNGSLFWGSCERGPLCDLTRDTHAEMPPRLREAVGYDRCIWRRVAPNLVVHPLFGDAVAFATDGVHALLDIGGGHLEEVARTSVLGPLGPERIAPQDWDWDRNARRVRVFRRKAPKPPVILPVNSELDAYWARFAEMSDADHLAAAALVGDYRLRKLACVLASFDETEPQYATLRKALLRNTAELAARVTRQLAQSAATPKEASVGVRARKAALLASI